MLIGEYAVLDGGDAVVAAVDCYAEARLVATATASTPFISAALAHGRELLLRLGRPLPAGAPVVDTDGFSRNGRKLGLGSSAAATVAALGALCHEAGVELSAPAERGLLYEAARRAHDAAQGVSGSGADVLAATWGGLRTLRGSAVSNLSEARGPAPGDTLPLPAPLELRFVATSRSASTAELVARYRAVGAAASSARERMAEAARRFVQACHSGTAGEVLAAVAQAQAAFHALARALCRDLFTPEHQAIAAAAERVGGVAKPSGAGGGDLAVVFLPSAAAAESLTKYLLLEEGPQLVPLPFRISPYGVHVVPVPEKP
jgi:phosphomevalonate kinase